MASIGPICLVVWRFKIGSVWPESISGSTGRSPHSNGVRPPVKRPKDEANSTAPSIPSLVRALPTSPTLANKAVW